jgi:hypothetical protein
MSGNTTGSVNTKIGTNTGANTGATIAGTMGSRVKDVLTGKWTMGISGLTSIILLMVALTNMSQFAGSKDDWNLIQPQIVKVLILTLIGTVLLTIAALLYFIQDSARAIYFILIMVCISLGLSFSAVAIAAISR